MARWTEDDIAALMADNNAGVRRAAIAKRLGRSVGAVNYKAFEIGLRDGSRWDKKPDDIEVLRARWREIMPAMKAALLADIADTA